VMGFLKVPCIFSFLRVFFNLTCVDGLLAPVKGNLLELCSL
jgi:hypothetical protein